MQCAQCWCMVSRRVEHVVAVTLYTNKTASPNTITCIEHTASIVRTDDRYEKWWLVADVVFSLSLADAGDVSVGVVFLAMAQ